MWVFIWRKLNGERFVVGRCLIPLRGKRGRRGGLVGARLMDASPLIGTWVPCEDLILASDSMLAVSHTKRSRALDPINTPSPSLTSLQLHLHREIIVAAHTLNPITIYFSLQMLLKQTPTGRIRSYTP